MSLFNANISVRIVIEGCPETGLEALDWRRAHGLPERLDNRHDVKIQRGLTEEHFRRLVAAGWVASVYSDGSATVESNRLGYRFCPMGTSHYGHRATIPVRKEDSDIDLLCRALKHCAWEERRAEAGAEELEVRRAELESEIEDIDSKLAAI